MCDYSLHGVKNRLATEGEQLFVNMFHTGSKGLASKADYEARRPVEIMRLLSFVGVIGRVSFDLPAICVPPGARLRLTGIPKRTRQLFGLNESEEVTFHQMALEAFGYRDAVKFDHLVRFCYAQGRNVLSLQNLDPGIRVEVLSLEEQAEAETEERRIAANV